jgi:hypothetical protein
MTCTVALNVSTHISKLFRLRHKLALRMRYTLKILNICTVEKHKNGGSASNSDNYITGMLTHFAFEILWCCAMYRCSFDSYIIKNPLSEAVIRDH